MRRVWVILMLCLAEAFAGAQVADFLSRAELVISGGGMGYVGDLNDQRLFSTPGLALGGGLCYRLDNRWSVGGEVRYGRVGCATDCLPMRNLSFRSHVAEFSVRVQFNFLPLGTGATDYRWSPYLFGGIGAFHFNPEATYVDADGTQRWVALQPLGTEGQGSAAYPDRKPYSLVQLCLPFGVGVKARLNSTFSVEIEYGFRKSWTDYLDDVSTTYVGSEVLDNGRVNGALAARLADRSGEVAGGEANAAGIKRGDDSLDDWYTCFHVSVGISLEALLGWTRRKQCEQ